MSTWELAVAAALIFIDLSVCFTIGLRTSRGSVSAEDYFIGGKKTGTLLLFLSTWASFSGAGNFIGQAGRGALQGISAYWLYLGEGFFGGIIMGYLLAPYLSQFRYFTMPHYLSDYLFGNDHYIRRAGGLAALMPNIVWPGAQIMGISYVLEQLFGIDYRVAVLICGIIFVFYTMSGGVSAVIYADVIHGTIQMFFAAFVVFFGLKTFNFDLGFLKEQILIVDPSKWDLFVQSPFGIATSFLTGLVGALSNPIFWNRAFAAKDQATARKAYGVTFFLNIIMVATMILLGIATLMFNQTAGDQSLVWLILNKMPSFVGTILAESVLAACMSSADTHLNCAAANVVSDIMDPDGKLDGKTSVRYAKIATLVCGILAMLAGMFADYIYQIGNYGYTVCGGVLIPAFIIGLIHRDRKSKEFRSRMSVKAGRIGMTIGIVLALSFEIIPPLQAVFGGGVIPAIFGTSIGMLTANYFCTDQTIPKKAV